MEEQGRAAASPEFGTLLRRYRLAAGLSQDALAERARLSCEAISALERGYRRTPQRETLALLAGALALDGESRETFEAAARASSARRRASLALAPLALTNFIGRQTEISEIAALVEQHRLVTLIGPGGVGKTQTALRVANAMKDAPLEACFVPLVPVAAPTPVVTALAAAFGVQEAPRRPLVDTLIGVLKDKPRLLIFDNCEHVIEEAADVARALLSGSSHIRILATSREPLRAAGEYAYRLHPLSEEDAVALFTDRAKAVNHRFFLDDETAPIVAAICRQLDGIPLAIELAAARMSALSVSALAQRLIDRVQPMQTSIEWSYDLLTEQERRVFERLAVFDGGATLEMATSVCTGGDVPAEEMLALIASLVDKSLLVADLESPEPRYRLLKSFRQYARERLSARGELHATARRHAEACLERIDPPLSS